MTNGLRGVISEYRKDKSQKIYTDKLLVAIEIYGTDDYIKKTDTDNFAKFILDALKGVVYKDDKQIYCLIVNKISCAWGGIRIGLSRLADDKFPLYPHLPVLGNDDLWTSSLTKEYTWRTSEAETCNPQ